MSKENIIKTITIDIAGTEVEVTPKQAKALHEALESLLGLDQPKVVEKTVYRDNWYPRWLYPYYTWTSTGTVNHPELDKYTVSYSDKTNNACLSIT